MTQVHARPNLTRLIEFCPISVFSLREQLADGTYGRFYGELKKKKRKRGRYEKAREKGGKLAKRSDEGCASGRGLRSFRHAL